jgi:hypothetical protein
MDFNTNYKSATQDGEDQPFYKKWFGSSTKGGYSDMEIGSDSVSSFSYGSSDTEGQSLIDQAKNKAGVL